MLTGPSLSRAGSLPHRICLNAHVTSWQGRALAVFPILYQPHWHIRRWQHLYPANQVRSPFGEHDGRRIEVAVRFGREHRRVDDPQALDAMHPQLGIHYRHVVLAHAARTTGVVSAFEVVTDKGVEVFIAGHQRSGSDFAVAETVHGFLADDLPGQTDAAAEAFAVLFALQVVEANLRVFVRIGRPHAHIATAFRFVWPCEHHETVALDRLVAVVAHRCRQEVELDVRPAQALLGANETTGLEVVGGAQAVLEQQPAQTDHQFAQRVHLAVERHRFLAAELDVHLGVILQVLPYPRQVMAHADPD